jgi:coproporphyrinogen III oxidase-like Fe-S oxidoreductase
VRAWQALTWDLAGADPARPMCIYIHIRFCSSKCGFCDSYSFKLGSHGDEHIERYLEHICVESLTPKMIAALHELGFRRLHIGVQTMEDHVRAIIGRRRSSEEVLQATRAILPLGWVVSVDLLCGLPGQTLEGYLGGIHSLMAAGVNGFSLYELLIRSQNRGWAEFHTLTRCNHLPNYFMMQAGANLLESNGYRKNLFNHWADKKDANIYFTFPTRAEDCLAIGAIADGVFGDYHYRHSRYAGYLKADHSRLPGLEGGLRRNARETQLQPLTTAILSGRIPPDLTYRWMQVAD